MTTTARWRLDEAEAHALSDALVERTDATAVDVTDAKEQFDVIAYFESSPDVTDLRRLAVQVLGRKSTPRLEELAAEDWVAQSLAALPPVRAGRYLVHGGHDRQAKRANDIAIEIDAGLAFGTGHHGTTVGCLAALDRLSPTDAPRSILDVGTGSGVLAIAAAKTWGVPVIATDIDPVAARIAATNAQLNGVGKLVKSVHADGLRSPRVRNQRFDLVIANILARPLAGLAGAIARQLTDGGFAILSGLVPTQRRWITAAYRSRGIVFRKALIVDGWLTLVLQRPHSIAATRSVP